ncbi:hypothetical protein [Tenacibaculum jejuense]|uniref:Uncharacterized protein n=1 Tax=Tenacibaculum jejuense TaxID=584609 RepID=A0A238UE56_9FLAO|nr:hypothetical protein [Tenacibaculum jejuense]SNR17286.1 conserved protein of unknown function [Tenacibaculum jejuense]
MDNIINVSKCDNQLIIIAVNNSNENETVEICNIKSGNFNKVNVNIKIEDSGSNNIPEPIKLNGLEQDLSGTYTIKVPSGDYSLIYSGINWGGPYNFQFTFNDKLYELLDGSGGNLVGSIWNLGNLDIKFNINSST